MFTSMVWVALVGSTNSAALLPAVPAWQSDYKAAKKQSAEEKKPLAVVIGNGAAGWETLSRDGKIDAAVVELLKAQYVCVYIDATTERGQKLATAFEMTQGVVLSDRGGEQQAFRHEGALTNGDLDNVLRRFAEPTRQVTRTETHNQVVTSNYPTMTAPTMTAPTMMQQNLAPYYYPGATGGSSCPSCQRR